MTCISPHEEPCLDDTERKVHTAAKMHRRRKTVSASIHAAGVLLRSLHDTSALVIPPCATDRNSFRNAFGRIVCQRCDCPSAVSNRRLLVEATFPKVS